MTMAKDLIFFEDGKYFISSLDGGPFDKTRNGAFKANYKGINEVCKKVDELQTVPSIINLWALEVSPFLKEISTSHFIFMQEYFNAKINEHK